MERASRTSAGVSSSKQQTGWVKAAQPFCVCQRSPHWAWILAWQDLQRATRLSRACVPPSESGCLVMHLFGGVSLPSCWHSSHSGCSWMYRSRMRFPGTAIPAAYSRVTVVLRSVWPPPWRAPRRTCRPSAWDSRGYEQGRLSSVYRSFPCKHEKLSLLVLFPQSRLCGKAKPPQGAPTMASFDSLGNFNDTLRSYSHSIHRTLMFPGGREIPAAPSHAGGRCAGWSSPYPRRSSPTA